MVEVAFKPGIGIHIVGLTTESVKKSLIRTITAIQTAGYHIPGEKITVNFAPADITKNGENYDIPIAVGIIAASKQAELPFIKDYSMAGRLGLDGSIYEAENPDELIKVTKAQGLKGCILPLNSALQIKDKQGIEVWGLSNIKEVIQLLKEGETFETNDYEKY